MKPHPSALCNRLLLDLNRGPVLASEIEGNAEYALRYLRLLLKPMGKRIISRSIHRPTRYGRVLDWVYTLV
jgi:hypothetical protein